jgi:ribosome biogenesis GTPase
MQGLVIKSTGSWYQVHAENGVSYDCRIKGKFRIQGIQTTNPIAVGDEIEFELEPNSDQGIINKLHDRRNYIIRKSINLSKQAQIIAANMDQAFLVVTLASPRTSLGFIDRFLATAEAYSIPSMLIFGNIRRIQSNLRAHRLPMLHRICFRRHQHSADRRFIKRQDYFIFRTLRRWKV